MLCLSCHTAQKHGDPVRCVVIHSDCTVADLEHDLRTVETDRKARLPEQRLRYAKTHVKAPTANCGLMPLLMTRSAFKS